MFTQVGNIISCLWQTFGDLQKSVYLCATPQFKLKWITQINLNKYLCNYFENATAVYHV